MPREYVFIWDVMCTKCGARPDERCRNRLGNLKKFHVERIEAAKRALELGG